MERRAGLDPPARQEPDRLGRQETRQLFQAHPEVQAAPAPMADRAGQDPPARPQALQ